METKILEEMRKHFRNDVIDSDWEPVWKQPKRRGMESFIPSSGTSFLWVYILEG